MIKHFDQHLDIGSLNSTCGVEALDGPINQVGEHPLGRPGIKIPNQPARWMNF